MARLDVVVQDLRGGALDGVTIRGGAPSDEDRRGLDPEQELEEIGAAGSFQVPEHGQLVVRFERAGAPTLQVALDLSDPEQPDFKHGSPECMDLSAVRAGGSARPPTFRLVLRWGEPQELVFLTGTNPAHRFAAAARGRLARLVHEGAVEPSCVLTMFAYSRGPERKHRLVRRTFLVDESERAQLTERQLLRFRGTALMTRKEWELDHEEVSVLTAYRYLAQVGQEREHTVRELGFFAQGDFFGPRLLGTRLPRAQCRDAVDDRGRVQTDPGETRHTCSLDTCTPHCRTDAPHQNLTRIRVPPLWGENYRYRQLAAGASWPYVDLVLARRDDDHEGLGQHSRGVHDRDPRNTDFIEGMLRDVDVSDMAAALHEEATIRVWGNHNHPLAAALRGWRRRPAERTDRQVQVRTSWNPGGTDQRKDVRWDVREGDARLFYLSRLRRSFAQSIAVALNKPCYAPPPGVYAVFDPGPLGAMKTRGGNELTPYALEQLYPGRSARRGKVDDGGYLQFPADRPDPVTHTITVLVTGFTPFRHWGGHFVPYNASGEAVEILRDHPEWVTDRLNAPPWLDVRLNLIADPEVDVVWTSPAPRYDRDFSLRTRPITGNRPAAKRRAARFLVKGDIVLRGGREWRVDAVRGNRASHRLTFQATPLTVFPEGLEAWRAGLRSRNGDGNPFYDPGAATSFQRTIPPRKSDPPKPGGADRILAKAEEGKNGHGAELVFIVGETEGLNHRRIRQGFPGAGEAAELRVERFANNRGTRGNPDNAGLRLSGAEGAEFEPLDRGRPYPRSETDRTTGRLESTIPLRAWLQAITDLRRAGFRVDHGETRDDRTGDDHQPPDIRTSTGSYICNETFFRNLVDAREGGRGRGTATGRWVSMVHLQSEHASMDFDTGTIERPRSDADLRRKAEALATLVASCVDSMTWSTEVWGVAVGEPRSGGADLAVHVRPPEPTRFVPYRADGPNDVLLRCELEPRFTPLDVEVEIRDREGAVVHTERLEGVEDIGDGLDYRWDGRQGRDRVDARDSPFRIRVSVHREGRAAQSDPVEVTAVPLVTDCFVVSNEAAGGALTSANKFVDHAAQPDLAGVIEATVARRGGRAVQAHFLLDDPLPAREAELPGGRTVSLESWDDDRWSRLTQVWQRIVARGLHAPRYRAKQRRERLAHDAEFTNVIANDPHESLVAQGDSRSERDPAGRDVLEYVHVPFHMGSSPQVDRKAGTYRYRFDVEYRDPALRLGSAAPGSFGRRSLEETTETEVHSGLSGADYSTRGQATGIAERVHRISRKGDSTSTFFAHLESFRNVPWIYGSTNGQAYQLLGYDCAELIFAAARHAGLTRLRDFSNANDLCRNKTHHRGQTPVFTVENGRLVTHQGQVPITIHLRAGGDDPGRQEYHARIGDIVFFDWDGNGRWDHTTVIWAEDDDGDGDLRLDTQFLWAGHGHPETEVDGFKVGSLRTLSGHHGTEMRIVIRHFDQSEAGQSPRDL